MTRRSARGLTLIELLVTIALVAIVTTAVLMGSGALVNSRMRGASSMITGAIRIAFTRASATSRVNRLVFDIDGSRVWLEESTNPVLVTKNDATGGASAATQQEREALEQADRIMKGPRAPRPKFVAVKALGFEQAEKTEESPNGGRPLGAGVKFRKIETAHTPDGQTSGRAYLYFWPGGQTERASIQLQVGEKAGLDDGISLLVAPLTGKVHAVSGSKSMEPPRDDGTNSEREDRSF